jgi:hypothetical protein
MNGYIAFCGSRRTEVYANTSYEAQTMAAKFFKMRPSKQHMISVVLCEKGGEQVTHSTGGL